MSWCVYICPTPVSLLVFWSFSHIQSHCSCEAISKHAISVQSNRRHHVFTHALFPSVPPASPFLLLLDPSLPPLPATPRFPSQLHVFYPSLHSLALTKPLLENPIILFLVPCPVFINFAFIFIGCPCFSLWFCPTPLLCLVCDRVLLRSPGCLKLRIIPAPWVIGWTGTQPHNPPVLCLITSVPYLPGSF